MAASAASTRSDTIEAHLPLVRSIAQRYVRHGEPLEDLVQVGTLGLIKAVDRFDPSRDVALSALARPSIEGEIRHHLRDAGCGPHVPRTDRELAARVHDAEAGLIARLRRAPTHAELAQAVGVDEEGVARALQAHDAARPVVLDDAAPDRSTVARGADAAEARLLLEAGWDILDERERRLLELRYRQDFSQREIARELGLSQAHVSRLLRAALDRLRGELDPPAEDDHEDHDGSEARRSAPAPATTMTTATTTAMTTVTTTATPATRPDGRSGRLLLRLPRSLHAELAEAAEREGVPLNTFIAGTLSAAVVAPDPDPHPHPDPSPDPEPIPDPEPVPGGPDLEPAATTDVPPMTHLRSLLVLNALVIASAAIVGAALLLHA
ncbi:MAG TPA: sigma-70 family RNA polymerase sigma factor [Baekduia sp.]|jgi:RNA polymerase sigma-B factor|nr:sigma-70 family RNA polymerase sigma factor [Baekduia sp.]